MANETSKYSDSKIEKSGIIKNHLDRNEKIEGGTLCFFLIPITLLT